MKKAGLEFHVGDERGQGTTIFTNFDKAAGFALSRACSTGDAMNTKAPKFTVYEDGYVHVHT